MADLTAGGPASLPGDGDEFRLDGVADLARAWGATDAEVTAAEVAGTLPELALELALRGSSETVSFAEAAAGTGLGPADALTLWRALGLPEADADAARLDAAQAAALGFLARVWQEVLGRQTTLQIARAVGAALATVAEALVDAFRLEVEVPSRRAGRRYAEVVAEIAAAADELLPPFVAAMEAVLRRHLVHAARGRWSVDADQLAVSRPRTIGFVDLVGYTAAAAQASPGELAAAMDRFEGTVADLVAGHGGRLVKLIGDEAMFAVEDPVAACRLGLALAAAFGGDDGLPPARTALAHGPAVAIHGDYFGAVVNLAARLAGVGEPAEVVVSADLAEAVAGRFDCQALPPARLKGFAEPVVAFRLRAADGT